MVLVVFPMALTLATAIAAGHEVFMGVGHYLQDALYFRLVRGGISRRPGIGVNPDDSWRGNQPTDPDPLPSWNEGQAKHSIVSFVNGVTQEGGPDFVPAPERIAVFDNDGTLWSEQPIYFQLAFALDRVKALFPAAPGVGGNGAVRLYFKGRSANSSAVIPA
jgi:hypothetical protein